MKGRKAASSDVSSRWSILSSWESCFTSWEFWRLRFKLNGWKGILWWPRGLGLWPSTTGGPGLFPRRELRTPSYSRGQKEKKKKLKIDIPLLCSLHVVTWNVPAIRWYPKRAQHPFWTCSKSTFWGPTYTFWHKNPGRGNWKSWPPPYPNYSN